jgi:Protein of unknown function with PCYCGC motif
MKKIFGTVFVALITMGAFAQWNGQPGDIPAFHPAPPRKTDKLGPILSGPALKGPGFDQPFQAHAYELAAKVDKVLYQQPCYCHCDRHAGHTSLRSCFEDTHGAHCGTCLKEAYFAYAQTKAHKTPAQIRSAIIKGDYESVDLWSAAEIK